MAIPSGRMTNMAAKQMQVKPLPNLSKLEGPLSLNIDM